MFEFPFIISQMVDSPFNTKTYVNTIKQKVNTAFSKYIMIFISDKRNVLCDIPYIELTKRRMLIKLNKHFIYILFCVFKH